MHEEAIPSSAPVPRPIAHWTHTLALCVILALGAVYSHTRETAFKAGEHIQRYSSSIIMEWLLLGAVIAGIYVRRDFFLRAFQQPARSNAVSFALGFAAYAAGTVAVLVTGLALHFTPLGQRRNTDVVLALLPHGPLEFVLWFFVSLSAGVCEEIIFRGYLMQQIAAWTKRPLLAVAITALLFGSVHLYEGVGAILPLAGIGFVYGLFVHYGKGDLRAAIVAHTLQDFFVAVFAALALHLKQFLPH